MGVTRFTLLVVGMILSASNALGQPVSEQRVREAIDDAARGVGQAVAGGSPLTAPANTTGGLGHFQVVAAGNVTRMEIEDPRVDEGTVDFYLPVGSLQGAVGITDGGVLGFGAIDVIGRAGQVVAREEYRESQLLVALGARVGVLRETVAAPAVSVTVSRSWVEGLEWGDPDDEVHFNGDVAALSARVDVSKSFLLVTPYVGLGIDRTAIDADYRIPASLATGGSEIQGHFDTSSTHQKAYTGVDLAVALVRASIEVGIYDGGAFGAIGLRVGL